MNVYVTSDLHLGHEKVAKLRGFDSVQAHDELVINRWNCHVRGNSPIVYVLGDVMMGDRDRGRKLLKGLRGELLVLGNHDRAAPNNKNGHRHIEAMGDVWASVTTSASISYNGQKFLMSHYPYDGDSQEESRFDQWRLRDSPLTRPRSFRRSSHLFESRNSSVPCRSGCLESSTCPTVSHRCPSRRVGEIVCMENASLKFQMRT